MGIAGTDSSLHSHEATLWFLIMVLNSLVSRVNNTNCMHTAVGVHKVGVHAELAATSRYFAKPQDLDKSTSWSVFGAEFEAIASLNY